MAQQLDAAKLQLQVQAESFDALYNRFASTIFHYLYRQVSHAQDAEDLLLEVFLAALKYEPLYALSAERQLAWLRHVARNKVVDRYRRRVLLTMLPLEQARETEDQRLTPEAYAERREDYAQLARAFGQLSPLQQQILQMRYGNGMRLVDIAHVLGKPEGTVRSLFARTLERLRILYELIERE